MAYISTAAPKTISPFAGIAKTFKSMIFKMQMGQMLSVLSRMSDRDLAQIGITRAEIPAYAKTLMPGEV